MSNTAGNNTIPILVTDISGSAVIGLSTVDFDVECQIGTTLLNNTATITASTSSAGMYLLNMDLIAGQGYLKVGTINPSYYVSPEYYQLDLDTYDTNDVYLSIARQSLDVTQTAIGSYESNSIGPWKENDTVVIEYVVPTSVMPTGISGCSNFKASLYSSAALTSISGSGYIADFNLTTDAPNNIVTMVMAASSTNNLVPEGLTSAYYYSDLQCVTSLGYNKTLAEFTLEFKRQFCRG